MWHIFGRRRTLFSCTKSDTNHLSAYCIFQINQKVWYPFSNACFPVILWYISWQRISILLSSLLKQKDQWPVLIWSSTPSYIKLWYIIPSFTETQVANSSTGEVTEPSPLMNQFFAQEISNLTILSIDIIILPNLCQITANWQCIAQLCFKGVSMSLWQQSS